MQLLILVEQPDNYSERTRFARPHLPGLGPQAADAVKKSGEMEWPARYWSEPWATTPGALYTCSTRIRSFTEPEKSPEQ